MTRIEPGIFKAYDIRGLYPDELHREARVDDDAITEAPFYVGPGCHVAGGARIGPDTVLVGEVTVAKGAKIRDSVVWRGASIESDAEVEESLVGPGVRIGHSARVERAVLGEGSVLSDFSRSS